MRVYMCPNTMMRMRAHGNTYVRMVFKGYTLAHMHTHMLLSAHGCEKACAYDERFFHVDSFLFLTKKTCMNMHK